MIREHSCMGDVRMSQRLLTILFASIRSRFALLYASLLRRFPLPRWEELDLFSC